MQYTCIRCRRRDACSLLGCRRRRLTTVSCRNQESPDRLPRPRVIRRRRRRRPRGFVQRPAAVIVSVLVSVFDASQWCSTFILLFPTIPVKNARSSDRPDTPSNAEFDLPSKFSAPLGVTRRSTYPVRSGLESVHWFFRSYTDRSPNTGTYTNSCFSKTLNYTDNFFGFFRSPLIFVKLRLRTAPTRVKLGLA